MRAPFVSSNSVFHMKSFNFVWKDKSPFGLSTAFIKSLFSFKNSRIEVISTNGVVGEGFDPSSAIIFIAISKMPISTRKENFILKIKQIVTGAIAALVIGFGLTWIADGMVGLNIPNLMDTALFLSIKSFSFFLMISAVLSLMGLKGIGIFALLLFFGAPLLALAPEMMSPFYQDWIYSWLPMRFMIEGLREIFFFGKGLSWSTPVTVLVWIGVVSIVIILGTALKRSVGKEHKTEVNA